MTKRDSTTSPAIAPECFAPWEIEDKLETLTFFLERLERRLAVLEATAQEHLQAYIKHVTVTHGGWSTRPAGRPTPATRSRRSVATSAGTRSGGTAAVVEAHESVRKQSA